VIVDIIVNNHSIVPWRLPNGDESEALPVCAGVVPTLAAFEVTV